MKNKKEWKVKKLEEIATEIFTGTKRASPYLSSETFPIVKLENLRNNFLKIVRIEDLKKTVNKSNVKNFCSLGDLLIAANTVSYENAGNVCVYFSDLEAAVDSNIYVVKHKENSLYLNYLLNSQCMKKQIITFINKKKSHGNIANIFYLTDLKKLQLALPPLNIQNLIGNYLYKLSLLEEQLKSRSWNSFTTIAKRY